MSVNELTQLRKRVKAQRAELRRINKQVTAYWQGFRRALDISAAMELRGKMIKAFGHEAVQKAERGAK